MSCNVGMHCQWGPGCTLLETEQQQGWYSCLPSTVLRLLCAFAESRFLGMECKKGGKSHVKINKKLETVSKQVPWGKMKITLKRELEEFEFGKWKASKRHWDWQDCCFSVLPLTCVHCWWWGTGIVMAYLSAVSAAVGRRQLIGITWTACWRGHVFTCACLLMEHSVVWKSVRFVVAIFSCLHPFAELFTFGHRILLIFLLLDPSWNTDQGV